MIITEAMRKAALVRMIDAEHAAAERCHARAQAKAASIHLARAGRFLVELEEMPA